MRNDPIIITGAKRTGTRMLAAICEQLGIYFGEKKYLGEKYEHEAVYDIMSEDSVELLKDHFTGEKRWGLKHPVLTDYIDKIYERFPKARVIYITREFKMPETKEAFDSFNYSGLEVKFGDKDCEKCLKKRFEKKQALRLTTFKKACPKDLPVLYIHYDDFVFNPIQGIREIAQFLDVDVKEETFNWVKDFVYTNRSARSQ